MRKCEQKRKEGAHVVQNTRVWMKGPTILSDADSSHVDVTGAWWFDSDD